MAVPISKVSSNPVAPIKTACSNSHGILYSFSKSKQPHQIHITSRCIGNGNGHLLEGKINYCEYSAWNLPGKNFNYTFSRRSLVLCFSNGTHHTERKEFVRTYGDSGDVNRSDGNNEDKLPIIPKKFTHRNRGLAEACRFACNDAKFVNERARNDMVLLSRGIMRLDARARQDVAMLGSEFIKLDARAREDTELIDRNVKKKAECVRSIAANLREMAHSSLKSAADEHWSDGALKADLRRADCRAKKRAMEDALMALEFVKDIHDMMVSKMYDFPLSKEKGSSSLNYMTGRIMLEKNGKTTDFFPGEVSTDRITAIQEIYYSMAAALSEADGIDYTDPEELELLIATLIDLDAMDGKSSVSLLAECSSSPDVNTRRALANALAAAPSMWTLGNAGMGALQRLAEDNNPTIASAASNAIYELKKQWEIEEGDSWRFTMNPETMQGEDKS